MSGPFNKFKNRKHEHKQREETVSGIMAVLNAMSDKLPEIEEKKPWIPEAELNDVREKAAEYRIWLETKLAEQEEVGLQADAVLTEKEMSDKMEKVAKLYRKVTDKKQPKERKPKKTE